MSTPKTTGAAGTLPGDALGGSMITLLPIAQTPIRYLRAVEPHECTIAGLVFIDLLTVRDAADLPAEVRAWAHSILVRQ